MKFLIKTKCGVTLISDNLTSEYPLFFSETDVISFGSIGVNKDNLLYYAPYEELKVNTLKCDNMDIDNFGNVNFKCNEINAKEKIYVNGVDVEELKKYHEELLRKSNEMTVKELDKLMSRKIREMQEASKEANTKKSIYDSHGCSTMEEFAEKVRERFKNGI